MHRGSANIQLQTLHLKQFFSHLHNKSKSSNYGTSEAATHRNKFDRRASLLLSLVRWENITAPTLRAGSRFCFSVFFLHQFFHRYCNGLWITPKILLAPTRKLRATLSCQAAMPDRQFGRWMDRKARFLSQCDVHGKPSIKCGFLA